MSEFGLELRVTRQQLGLNQTELSDKLRDSGQPVFNRISPSAINAYETGRQLPLPRRAQALARWFKDPALLAVYAAEYKHPQEHKWQPQYRRSIGHHRVGNEIVAIDYKRVAHLAARGWSNPEIAAELHCSINALAKLRLGFRSGVSHGKRTRSIDRNELKRLVLAGRNDDEIATQLRSTTETIRKIRVRLGYRRREAFVPWRLPVIKRHPRTHYRISWRAGVTGSNPSTSRTTLRRAREKVDAIMAEYPELQELAAKETPGERKARLSPGATVTQKRSMKC